MFHNEKVMKILILTTNTGGGHNAAAKAIQEEANLRGIPCDIKNFMTFTSKFKERFVVDGHTLAYRYVPKTYGFGYHLMDESEKSGQRLYKEYGKYAKPLKDYIIRHGYDTVIAVHIFAGLMLSQIRDTYDLNIRQYLVITDYTCSPGGANCNMDAWFIPKGLKDLFIKKGVDEKRIVESGIPCNKKVYAKIEQREAKVQCGCDPDRPLIFLCAGNVTTSKIERITKKILNQTDDSNLVILCGRSRSRLIGRSCFNHERVQLLEKTDSMPLWMHGADVFITKAGGLTITEAASARVPLILSSSVPGLETLNRNFFLDHQCALSADKSDELVQKTLALMTDQALKDRLIKNQQLHFPDIAVEVLMDTVEEGAGFLHTLFSKRES